MKGSVGWGERSEEGKGDGQDAGAGAPDKRAYSGRWRNMALLQRRWPFLKQRGMKRAEESWHWAGGARGFVRGSAGVEGVGAMGASGEEAAGQVKAARVAEKVKLILYKMNPFLGLGADQTTPFIERLIISQLERAALAPWWNLVKLIGPRPGLDRGTGDVVGSPGYIRI